MSRLGIVSHDAGGAEILAAYAARLDTPYRLVLAGPALAVFRRRLGDISPITLDAALADCDTFLTGSSWQSDLEWRAIAAARAAGKPVATFLDHWTHYRERFVRQGVEHLPDTLWTGDVIAETMARTLFPETPVRRIDNPYVADIRTALAQLPPRPAAAGNGGLRALFLCEPLSEHGQQEYGDPRHWGYTEFEALRYFADHQHVLGQPLVSLTIRPHPSEMPGKYDAIAREIGPVATVGGHRPLLEEIVESDVVVGCESMAMVIALIAGRRVLCAIPPGGAPCSLPQPDIESLQQLLAR